MRIIAYCSYYKCKYILTVKENLVESNEDMLKVYIEHAKHDEICLKSSSSAPKRSPESSGTESIVSNKVRKKKSLLK